MKPLKEITSRLSELTRRELVELKVIVETLIELQGEKGTDTRQEPEPKQIMPGRKYYNNTGIPGKRGHIEEKMIPAKGKLYGPYLYLRYWWDSRLRSRYIGKPSV